MDTLTEQATALAMKCRAGQLQLSQALLTLKTDSERAAKSKMVARRGCIPPGSWIEDYNIIKAMVNRHFWRTWLIGSQAIELF